MAMFEHVELELGPVDVLMNNGSVNPFFGGARDIDPEDLIANLHGERQGPFYCARKLGRQASERLGDGMILNVASVGGVVALRKQAPFTASKHEMVDLTKTLALDLAPEVRVNVLASGCIKTAFSESVWQSESFHQDFLSTISQDRLADPEETASTAVYIVSNTAGDAIGGVHGVSASLLGDIPFVHVAFLRALSKTALQKHLSPAWLRG